MIHLPSLVSEQRGDTDRSYCLTKALAARNGNEFFDGYSRARENPLAMNYSVEQPGIRALLPEVKGVRVLDLGCGSGGFAHWLVDEGAESVLGIDPSANMLTAARGNPRPEIEFRQAFVEELELQESQFNLVVSSLMFHYIEDLKPVVEKIHSWLREGSCESSRSNTRSPRQSRANGQAG